jgi:eukaryotic-like serine/threonine-protein kinase
MSALPEREPEARIQAVHALPDPPAEFTPGTLIAGRYQVHDVIGRGGMATVYRGHDERLKRDVAIKVRHSLPSQPAPPMQEEQISSQLIHSNIVSIFDAGQIPDDEPGSGSTFIVMQYIQGTTAHDIAPVSWRRALDMMKQVAAGLAAAHARGFVHCDVTPGNVLIDRTGRVLLADFGIAVEAESEAEDFVHGSPSYIAPERVHGAKADARMDVFGLGGVFAFLLTAKHPRSGAPLELPERCPEAVREIIVRARAQDPVARYADASEFLEALESAPDVISRNADVDSYSDANAVTTHVPVERDYLVDAEKTMRADTVVAVVPHEPALSPGHSPDRTQLDRDRSERRSVFRARAILGVVLALILGVLIVDTTFNESAPAALGSPDAMAMVEMPDVSGMTFADAVEVLSESGIVVSRVDVVYGPGPLNEVVAQSPAVGQVLDGSETVTLVVRTGR